MTLTWNEFSNRLEERALEKRIPLSMFFELTARCNQQCKMCYVCVPANDKQAQAKELSAEQWLHLAREARALGLLKVTLTGGEIFLRKDFREIYEGLVELGLIVQFITNGTLITPEVVSWLKKMPPYRINITLYGSGRETCATITGYADSYDRTVAAIDSLLEAGINTAIRTTLVQGNKDDYDQLSDFAGQRGLMLGVVNYISPRREGEANSDPIGNRLSAKDLVQYEIHVAERNEHLMLLQEDIECERTDPGGDEFTAPRGVPIRDPDDPFKCTAGKSSAWITWDGRLIPCGLMSRPEADPFKNGFQNAWEEIKHYCSAVAVCEECSQCQYESVCDHCPARLLTETGDHARAAHYLCEVAKERWNHGFK